MVQVVTPILLTQSLNTGFELSRANPDMLVALTLKHGSIQDIGLQSPRKSPQRIVPTAVHPRIHVDRKPGLEAKIPDHEPATQVTEMRSGEVLQTVFCT